MAFDFSLPEKILRDYNQFEMRLGFRTSMHVTFIDEVHVLVLQSSADFLLDEIFGTHGVSLTVVWDLQLYYHG